MTRFRLPVLILLGVIVLAVSAWAWQTYRRVDGRTAQEWLAFTQQASHTVSYRASGRTTLNGKPATFTLDQGEGGRYAMQVTDHQGRRCRLGDDGRYAWYQTEAKTVRTRSATTPPAPQHARSRILGTGTQAGRAVVRILVQSGSARKIMHIDRETGVVLAMITHERRREVSRMQVRQITYSPVTVDACPPRAETILHTATRDALKQMLGEPVVEPRWLPDGMTLRGLFREKCSCCGDEMAVLRYADGVRQFTLFEKAGAHSCAMAEGCHMAPSSGELIESRRVGKVTVIAVGNLDRETMARVLQHLQ